MTGQNRAVAFFDGQNLYHAAKLAFGHLIPNYDPYSLAKRIASNNGWNLTEVRFYTGVPPAREDHKWHGFWSRKLAALGKRKDVFVFKRELRYRDKTLHAHGGSITARVPEEKGIDVRIALDMIRLAIDDAYDIAVLFSQDQDLSEVATEVKRISVEKSRKIAVFCAFPVSQDVPRHKRRGVNETNWIQMDQALYDSCLDARNYFK